MDSKQQERRPVEQPKQRRVGEGLAQDVQALIGQQFPGWDFRPKSLR